MSVIYKYFSGSGARCCGNPHLLSESKVEFSTVAPLFLIHISLVFLNFLNVPATSTTIYIMLGHMSDLGPHLLFSGAYGHLLRLQRLPMEEAFQVNKVPIYWVASFWKAVARMTVEPDNS